MTDQTISVEVVAGFLGRSGFPVNWSTDEIVPIELKQPLAEWWWRSEEDNRIDETVKDYLDWIASEGVKFG